MDWWKIDIRNEDVWDGRHTALVNEFESLWDSAGMPRNLPLFASRDFGSECSYYFPQTTTRVEAPLLSKYRVTTCQKPDHLKVCLVVVYDDSA